MPGRSNKFAGRLADPFITIEETAELLRVTDRTIRHMIADGRLKAYHLGPRIIRFRLSEVESALQPYGGANAAT